MWTAGRDPRVWKDPETIDPTRFLDSDGDFDKKKAVDSLAFGGGKRRCTGEQLGRLERFTFFTRMMQRCRFETVSGREYSMDGVYSFNMEL